MAKSDVTIPPDLLDELSQENSRWFELYDNHAKAPKTESSTELRLEDFWNIKNIIKNHFIYL